MCGIKKFRRKALFTKTTYFKNAILYVEAKGKLDIYNAPDYLDEIKEEALTKYARELILEFSEISFVASIGLRTILELYKITKAKGCQLKLRNVNEEILHAFKLTGFDSFLTIENNSDNQDLMPN